MSSQVEEIKQKTDIVALVGERVKLARAGRNFKGLCPFHNERTPSFMVSPELGIFKCFGCGKVGDVYNFLAEFEGMEFPEALEYLAKKTGVKLLPRQQDKNFEKKERLWEIMHLASEFYAYLLNIHKVGEKGLRYLKERGVRKETVETFKLGFAPEGWDLLIRYLVGKKKYTLEGLEDLGLVVRGRGRVYDRFRNRIIFPLRDARGRVIGLAGRVMPGSEIEGGKYINSPETELYHKSCHLYGIYENRAEIKKKDNAVLVEGELDVISSWQAGVRNTVAVKGTALTREQIELLRRYTRNITFALDADTAGDAATKRSISLSDSLGMNMKVVLLIGGKDPDDIAKADPKKWKQMVAGASSVYDFFITSCKKRLDLESGSGKKQASEEVIPVLSKITNAVERAHYIRKFAKALGVAEDSVTEEVTRFERTLTLEKEVRQETGKRQTESGEELTRDRLLERYLLSLLLQGGIGWLEEVEIFSMELITDPVIKKIIELLLGYKKQAKKYEAGVFINTLPAELRDKAQSAFLEEAGIGDEKFLDELVGVTEELGRIGVKNKLKQLSGEIEKYEEKKELTSAEEKELTNLKNKLSELSKELFL